MHAAPSHATINGARLAFVDIGKGSPVLFVHGAISDYRFWNLQMGALKDQFRCIAFNQRYFGPDARPEDAPPYSRATHTSDLITFIAALNLGPVHLVGTPTGENLRSRPR